MQPEIRDNYLQSLSSPLTLLKAQNAITATAKLRWDYKSSATGQNKKQQQSSSPDYTGIIECHFLIIWNGNPV